MNTLRAEQVALRQQMAQEISSLTKTAKETEMRLQGELDHIKDSYTELTVKYETDVVIVREQMHNIQLELDKEKNDHEQTKTARRSEPSQQQVPLPIVLTDPQPPEVSHSPQETLPETSNSTPSVWKRTRHFLGLRKPERWKKNKTSST